MASSPPNTATYITIGTAVLSALTAVGVAYLSYRSNTLQADINKINAISKTEEVALARNKFEDEQKVRRDKTVSENIPRLLGSNDSERRIAIAVLFTLYPNEAKDVLTTVNQAQNENPATDLAPLIIKAEQLNKTTGEWIIVIGSDSSLDQAKPEAQKAKANGFSPTIYKRGNWYATAVGPYATDVEATSANISVRSTLGRDSFVSNFNTWCRQPANRGEYFDCQ
jgi:hypothetical protein